MSVTEDMTNTLRAQANSHQPIVFDSQIYHDCREMGDVCQSVTAQYGTGGNNMPFVVNEQRDRTSTLAQRDHRDGRDLMISQTVRRLTPLECTRLQGYPDNWLNIPDASDNAKYKALGNSIALPFWEFLAHRFAQYGNVRTIGSLFDGIGGFPLVFKRAGCETLWTSEIDPFCERVVKYHADKGDL